MYDTVCAAQLHINIAVYLYIVHIVPFVYAKISRLAAQFRNQD